MTAESAPVLRARAVTKDFGQVRALEGVDLEVRPGEVHALLGLNGAGKTTLIRLLLGMVRPTAGRLEVLGRVLPDRRVWRQVGYLVEGPASYPELTVRENLALVARLRGLRSTRPVEEAIERFGLGGYATRRARDLSLGNRQRLGLAKALLHRPAVAVLDEPVNGLDPAGVVEIRELLVELARGGTAVLVSSHLLAEVARAATRITVLHQGRLVDDFPAGELAARVRRRLEVQAREVDRAVQAMAGAGFERTGRLLHTTNPDLVAHPEDVARRLVAADAPPTRLAVVEDDLESYFLRLVGVGRPDDEPQPRSLEVSGAQ